jgi:hypothetical protein
MDYLTFQTTAGRPTGRWFPQGSRNFLQLDLLSYLSFERVTHQKKTPGGKKKAAAAP